METSKASPYSASVLHRLLNKIHVLNRNALNKIPITNKLKCTSCFSPDKAQEVPAFHSCHSQNLEVSQIRALRLMIITTSKAKPTTKSWRGSVNQAENCVLCNSIGHVFSGPEIKQAQVTSTPVSPDSAGHARRTKPPALQPFKVKHRARAASSTAHPGNAPRAVQAVKLASQ